MKKKNFLLAAALMTAGCMTAETLPEGLVSLLPEGVKANISTERKLSKIKNVHMEKNCGLLMELLKEPN